MVLHVYTSLRYAEWQPLIAIVFLTVFICVFKWQTFTNTSAVTTSASSPPLTPSPTHRQLLISVADFISIIGFPHFSSLHLYATLRSHPSFPPNSQCCCDFVCATANDISIRLLLLPYVCTYLVCFYLLLLSLPQSKRVNWSVKDGNKQWNQNATKMVYTINHQHCRVLQFRSGSCWYRKQCECMRRRIWKNCCRHWGCMHCCYTSSWSW